ncbi:MAG TPA: hypothetical protein VEI96_05935 [Thermodesulfovibrionales bacterium]|nr:hypothetical protein [Thermodesulfovibrionales bacterium]
MDKNQKQTVCNFCGEHFKNAQAVRAHLKGCKAYQDRGDQASPGNFPRQISPREGLPKDKSDTPSKSKEHGKGAVIECDPPQFKEKEKVDQSCNEKMVSKHEGRRPRSDIIQETINKVIIYFHRFGYSVPSAAQSDAIQEIRKKLTILPVEETPPHSELVMIAEGIRDRFYQPVFQAQDGAQRKEKEAREKVSREEQDRSRAEIISAWEGLRQALQKSREEEEQQAEKLRIEENKARLVAWGKRYAQELLREEDLDALSKSEICDEVEQIVNEELSGTESLEDVEKLVEDILDEDLE